MNTGSLTPPRPAYLAHKARATVFRFAPLAGIALVLALLSAGARATTLAETVRAALERHPDYALAEARRRVGAGYRQQADSLLGGDPSLTFSANGDRLGSDHGYEEYVAGVSLPVWLPGQRSAKGAIADNMLRLADSELGRLGWEVAGEVLERAWTLRIAEADMKHFLEQAVAARALVADVEHRHQVGELSRNDLLLAQQDLVDAESAYQAAVNAVEQARLAWVSYTGQEELPEDLEGFSRLEARSSLDRHPRLLAALAAVATAVATAEDARRQRRAPPVLSLFAKRDRGSRRERYTDSLGVELSLPLGTRAPAAPAIAEAEALRTRAEAAARLVRRELELQLSQADRELAKADRLLRLARRKHDYSRARFKLARRAFELGEMDLYQLLLARRQANQATRELKLRRLEKERAAARRNHVLGVIPR